jgi:hypothetical protein
VQLLRGLSNLATLVAGALQPVSDGLTRAIAARIGKASRQGCSTLFIDVQGA